MIVKTCCCILSLQTGVVILACSYIFVAVAILVHNIAGKFESTPEGFTFVVIFLSLMLVTGLLMFLAAYHRSKSLCSVSVCFIVVMITLFLVGSGISFSNGTWLDYVCVDRQCPETLWFAPLKKWNCTQGVEPPDLEESTLVLQLRYWLQPNRSRTENTSYTDYYYDSAPSVRTVDLSHDSTLSDSTRYITLCKNTRREVESVVLMLINLAFMLFSVLIMFSYYQELSTIRKLHYV